MRASQSFLVIVLGLLLLWLAVTGRLEAVWSAAVGAASGADGEGGTSGGRGGGGPESVGSGPILGVRLPDYAEYLYPSFDRYLPTGGGDYRTMKGGAWSRVFVPVEP